MAQSTLSVKRRKGIGKSAAKRIRKEGFIPGVLYGRDMEESIPLTVNPLDLKRALSTEAKERTLLELKIRDDGGGEELTKITLLREVQYDHLTGRPLHFDFQEILMQEKITVEVPIEIVGKAVGVSTHGGILEEILREIEVECLPAAIPTSIKIDVSNLDIGDSIHIGDIKFPEGVEVLHDSDETVVTVLAPAVEEVAPKVEVAAEAEEKAEEEEEEKAPAKGAESE